LKKCSGCHLDYGPRPKLEMAYLYGSVARGHPLPSSDVDIALVLTESPPPYRQLMLELEIQAALETACGCPTWTCGQSTTLR
jgi:predicted nucleotidyltransferase